jgi:LacI family transcriptional regulator
MPIDKAGEPHPTASSDPSGPTRPERRTRARNTPRPRSSVTLLDVARAAGVSLATASRVVNGSVNRQPRQDLVNRVTQAAEELGYSANASAQAVARGFTTVVGLIVSDIADPYFSSIAAGVTEEAEKHGLLVTLASTKGSAEREVDYMVALRRQRPLAVVLVGSRRVHSPLEERLLREVRQFRADGGRVAAVSQPTLHVDTITMRNAEGAAELARALVDQGHRRFGVLSGPADLQTAAHRLQGFRAGLADRGVVLDDADIQSGEFTRDGGQEAARRLLARRPGIGCLFAVNDVMAIGAMAAAREAGRRLPDDLAVAGFDDIAAAADVSPSLTTVRIDLEAVGRDVMRLVLEPSPSDEPRVRHAGGSVILRESTARQG